MHLFRSLSVRPSLPIRPLLVPRINCKPPFRLFSAIPPKPHVKEWATSEVIEWARKIPGLVEEDVEKLKLQRLTGSDIFDLSEERLEKYGIPGGPRIKILKEIEKLKGGDTEETIQQQKTIRQHMLDQIKINSLPGDKMAFQNNHGNILKIATAILDNLKAFERRREIRYLKLISAHEAFGSGKTRIAQEALIRIRYMLNNNPNLKTKLETKYGTDMVQFLQNNMMLVYIDISEATADDKAKMGFPTYVATAVADHLGISIPAAFETIVDFKKWISGILPPDVGLFIVLDEFSSYVGKVAQSQNQPVTVIHSYNIWTEKVQRLQSIHNMTVLVSGRGAYLEVLGKGRFVSLRSPTEVVPLRLRGFSEDDLRGIFDNTLELKLIGNHMRTVGILDDFLLRLLRVTGGVPVFVHYCLMINNSELLKVASVSDIDKYLDHQVKLVPDKIRSPFVQFLNRPGAMKLYKTLMMASIFELTIIDQNIPLSEFTEEEKKEFEGFTTVNLMDLAVILNCYIQEIPNDEGQDYKLIFPEAVIDQWVKTVDDNEVPLVSVWMKQAAGITTPGQLFEQLSATMLTIRMNYGKATGRTLSEQFPFLRHTQIAKIPCQRIADKIEVLGKVHQCNTANNWWRDVFNTKDLPSETIIAFEEMSHSPDKIIRIGKIADTEHFLAIQDKNLSIGLTMNQLGANKNEIEKTEHILKGWRLLNKFDKIHITLVIFSTNLSDVPYGAFGSGNVIRRTVSTRSQYNEIKVPEGITIVILSKAELEAVFGKKNLKALPTLMEQKRASRIGVMSMLALFR